jgi:hypothetical protein
MIVDPEIVKNINITEVDRLDSDLGRNYRNAIQFISSEYGRNRLERIETLIEQSKAGMILELNSDNIEAARQQAALITGLEEAKGILFAEVIYEAEAISGQAISAMEDLDE